MLAAALSLVLAGPAPVVQTPARPEWIETLPQAEGRLYALGSAELGGRGEGEALQRAADRARLEVVSRLRASVKGQTRVATQTSESTRDGLKVGSGQRQVQDELSVSARAEDLPGLVVERTFLDRSGRSAYAMAYLDLGLAQSALGGRLARIREVRASLGAERSRKARWRLRACKAELARLQDSLELLAPAGVTLEPGLRETLGALDAQLAALEGADLPALDLANVSVGFHSNLDLPPGIEAYLAAQISACGLLRRTVNPDLILDVTFSGGAQGPEFIFADMDVYGGVTYRLEAELKLLDGGGTPIGRPAPIHLLQNGTPEGMVEQFRKQFERRLPKLIAAFQNEMQ